MADLARVLGIHELPDEAPLLSDDSSETWLSAGALRERAEKWRAKLASPRAFAFLYIPNTVEGVAQLLGAASAGHVIALLDPNLPETAKNALAELYQPGIIINGAIPRIREGLVDLHPDLAVLLSTSGSTGSPKFVRLTAKSLGQNACAIANVLDIRPPEAGCGHLPLHYSYGLSVLTSHLSAGAPVHLTNKSFLDSEFWPQIKHWSIAHLPGVPFHFTTLRRFGFDKLELPDLRVMTQAGGALDPRIRKLAHDYMDGRGGRFHVMYGQTEAAPRITTLSHDDFPEHFETVGPALPGGRIEIIDAQGQPCEPGSHGEVIYHGPNVMMGYAERLQDLASGDEMAGRLPTGDIGHLDTAGRLTVTGRTKRVGKIAGLRVNLDEVERCVNALPEDFAVVQSGEALVLHHLPTEDAEGLRARVMDLVMDRFTLPKVAYRFKQIEAFPRTSRNKIDYQAMS